MIFVTSNLHTHKPLGKIFINGVGKILGAIANIEGIVARTVIIMLNKMVNYLVYKFCLCGCNNF